MLYFVTSTVLLRVVVRGGAHVVLWLFFVAAVILAGIYAWLQFRGPVERDFKASRAASNA